MMVTEIRREKGPARVNPRTKKRRWVESEMRSIDEWIALQDMKLDRPEAIRRLVELVLKAKAK